MEGLTPALDRPQPDIPSPVAPRPILTSDLNLAAWHQSPGFQTFTGWLRERCQRVQARHILVGPYDDCSKSIQLLMTMLDVMLEWIKEVPPLPAANQRFGNLAFRTYIKLLEERLPPLLESWNLSDDLLSQLLPLWINSYAFGQPTRMDYGTGHELAFVLGLWCCVVSGWVGGQGKEHEEDELILRVFTRYTDLTTALQSTYRLEPAGSHGVWGLDDYCFLPYLFGAAQLLDTGVTPSQVLSTALDPPADFRPKDLYTLALARVKLFKHGAAFSEHSPMLYSLSLMPSFVKPFSGLMKMFHGEVVGKKVVVQGLWVGGWCWGPDVPRVEDHPNDRRKHENSSSEGTGTTAPWAAASGRQGVLEASRGIWRS